MTYKNISKWLLVILFVVGVVTCAYGFINGWPDKDQWNKDNDVASTLPATIQSMKDAGTEVLSDAEIDAKKAEIDAVRAVAERNNTRLLEIKAKIDETKSEWRKKQLVKELQAETDSLTKEAHKQITNEQLLSIIKELGFQYQQSEHMAGIAGNINLANNTITISNNKTHTSNKTTKIPLNNK